MLFRYPLVKVPKQINEYVVVEKSYQIVEKQWAPNNPKDF